MKRCAIIGGGISGLCSAYFLQKSNPEFEIHLYDAAANVGGVIRTEIVDGCILDGGPDSFLTQKKSAIRLCEELGLAGELVSSNDADRVTFIYHDRQLKRFPEGFFLMVPTRLQPFITTDLLSWPGKLAALNDLFSVPETHDITAGDFIEKRFGLEILNQIAEPLLSGVYGADIRRLSLKSALPQLWQMQQKGSLIRQMLKPATKPKESLFTTLSRGMQMLTLKLYEACSQVQFRLNNRVEEIRKNPKGWQMGAEFYDAIIIATSAAPRILAESGERIRQTIASVRRNSAIVVSLCYSNLHRQGFGWLIPLAERHSVLAATYVNNKFSGRCPPGKFLVRTFIGGNFATEWIERDDDHIYKEVMRELNRIAGIDQEPLFYRIYRWKDAMPEYALDHEKRIAEIEALATSERGLYFTGNIFSGVGIPDCISHAEKTIRKVLSP